MLLFYKHATLPLVSAPSLPSPHPSLLLKMLAHKLKQTNKRKWQQKREIQEEVNGSKKEGQAREDVCVCEGGEANQTGHPPRRRSVSHLPTLLSLSSIMTTFAHSKEVSCFIFFLPHMDVTLPQPISVAAMSM